MKREIVAVALVCFSVGVILYLLLSAKAPSVQRTFRQNPTKEPTQLALTSKMTNSLATQTQNLSRAAFVPTNVASRFVPQSATAAIGATPAPLEFTNLPPDAVMDQLRTTFRSYQSMFGGNPVGTNPEITAALNGGNSKQVQFIHEDYGMRINSRGELIDPWGTPYFFHQLSATEMEIHSAGPDRVLWTLDDLVIK
jgi:hypothetical protein